MTENEGNAVEMKERKCGAKTRAVCNDHSRSNKTSSNWETDAWGVGMVAMMVMMGLDLMRAMAVTVRSTRGSVYLLFHERARHGSKRAQRKSRSKRELLYK